MHLREIFFFTSFWMGLVNSELFSFKSLQSYANIFNMDGLLANQTDNELWHGLLRDCDKKVSFSCIQKNAYSYLDNVFVDRGNITVFDGLLLTKNNLNYGTCSKKDSLDENLVEDSSNDCENEEENESKEEENGRTFDGEPETPLEEVTNALRKKTVKFLANRDYELQLPDFFFEGARVKVSPREVDEDGALLRVDFGQTAVQSQGRIFKKIRKFIQNKLLTSLLALMLLIKLIKLKFMFIIPFLFGVGAAKKLFLKLLLFFIPAFAHIFKLCSSYYSQHHTKLHHHHHQIAHHHHHVPVPVPVPTYYDNHHHHHHDDEFSGYDYAHPHIQYRKDVEELREWGIEPYDEAYEEADQHLGASQMPGRVPGVLPAQVPQAFPAYGLPQYAANARPIVAPYQDKRVTAAAAQNLAYAGYLDETKFNRRTAQPTAPTASVPANPANIAIAVPTLASTANVKNSYAVFAQQNPKVQRTPAAGSKGTVQRQGYDDEYYGPIIARLEDIFGQLRFYEENCRERLICSMYKSPTVYAPHSNLVSNELSRDPQELKRGATETASSQKFHRYLAAARLGQDGGDCLRMYPCHINTE